MSPPRTVSPQQIMSQKFAKIDRLSSRLLLLQVPDPLWSGHGRVRSSLYLHRTVSDSLCSTINAASSGNTHDAFVSAAQKIGSSEQTVRAFSTSDDMQILTRLFYRSRTRALRPVVSAPLRLLPPQQRPPRPTTPRAQPGSASAAPLASLASSWASQLSRSRRFWHRVMYTTSGFRISHLCSCNRER